MLRASPALQDESRTITTLLPPELSRIKNLNAEQELLCLAKCATSLLGQSPSIANSKKSAAGASRTKGTVSTNAKILTKRLAKPEGFEPQEDSDAEHLQR